MKKKYKSIFLSDIHLFSKFCQADVLLEFLKEHKAENLFLLGDIIDLVTIKRKFYTNKTQMEILHKILKLSKKGCKIVYVLGNHDWEFRRFLKYNITLDNITICNEYVYNTLGKNVLLIHGDILDIPIVRSLYVLGDFGYTLILKLNNTFNKIRKIFKMPYWSLSQRIKHSVKDAVKFIENYEENLLKYCKTKKHDAVFSGHIHKCNLDIVDGLLVGNCGDWQESCTAIAEDYDGNFILIQYINGQFVELKKINWK